MADIIYEAKTGGQRKKTVLLLLNCGFGHHNNIIFSSSQPCEMRCLRPVAFI